MPSVEKYEDKDAPPVIEWTGVESHFFEIAPGDKEEMKKYSEILMRTNKGIADLTLHRVDNMRWHEGNKMYAFISFFTGKVKNPKKPKAKP